MPWDKIKAAQKFLQQANAIHPEDAGRTDLHARALARQDVYYDCYMSSFTKEELLKRLQAIISGKIEMPEEEEVDEGIYRETYAAEAKLIHASIENGEFKI